jgi:hypothetical protein
MTPVGGARAATPSGLTMRARSCGSWTSRATSMTPGRKAATTSISPSSTPATTANHRQRGESRRPSGNSRNTNTNTTAAWESTQTQLPTQATQRSCGSPVAA